VATVIVQPPKLHPLPPLPQKPHLLNGQTPQQASRWHYNREGQVKPTARRTQGQALRVLANIFTSYCFIFYGVKLFAKNLASPPVALNVAHHGYNAPALFQ